MTTKELIGKVAKLFNLKENFISLTFDFQPDNCTEKLNITIEEGDEESYQHALTVLPNYSRVTVEMSIQRMKEISISGERKYRRKEVVAEEIKREMGLHDDQGKGKKGYMDAKWTAKCDTLMEHDSRFLFEYDKLQSGVELAFGDKRYLLNPFQIICPTVPTTGKLTIPYPVPRDGNPVPRDWNPVPWDGNPVPRDKNPVPRD
jgi:hypothetical protein